MSDLNILRNERPATLVGAGEDPILAPDRDATHLSLGSVVGHAQAAVIEEAVSAGQRLRP